MLTSLSKIFNKKDEQLEKTNTYSHVDFEDLNLDFGPQIAQILTNLLSLLSNE